MWARTIKNNGETVVPSATNATPHSRAGKAALVTCIAMMDPL